MAYSDMWFCLYTAEAYAGTIALTVLWQRLTAWRTHRVDRPDK